ncbi:MAG: hypothetical protein MI725_11750, partial [Pirellulales bacterium]|nr:hypothetical protein [Pirellulales bacterium]
EICQLLLISLTLRFVGRNLGGGSNSMGSVAPALMTGFRAFLPNSGAIIPWPWQFGNQAIRCQPLTAAVAGLATSPQDSRQSPG